MALVAARGFRRSLGTGKSLSFVGPLMDDLPLVGWLVLVPFVLCWVGGVVSFCYMAYYLVKTMARYRADRQWGKFVGFSFLFPVFFTEEGNVYRAQLVKWIGRFLIFLASGALIGLAVKFATGH